MSREVGKVVRSLAGRDRGRLLFVTDIDDSFVYVCDGKERPLERPKRKNPRHLEPTEFRLSEAQAATNRSLRKALATLYGAKDNSR